MDDEKVLRHLIHGIYESAVDARQWPRFLGAFADAVGAHAAGLIVQDLREQQGSLSEGQGFDPFWQQRYAEHYAGLNIWLERGGDVLRHPGSIMTSEQVMSDSELVKTEFYNDFLRPQQHFYSFGASITREESVISGITALRSKSAGGFAAAEIDLLRELMPHLQTALRLHHRISGLALRLEHTSAALDQLGQGLLITDSVGRIVFMNRPAESILRTGDGLMLAADGLRARRPDDTARLRTLIAGAAAIITGNSLHPGGGLSIPRSGGKGPLTLQVAPLQVAPLASSGQRAAAVVFIRAPEYQTVSGSSVLQDLLDLTPAEARLTSALVSGKTIRQFAEEAEVTLNTARTHLKSVFSKTGVSRQADLVRLALTITK
jgi:DNA-binding CsgD family transcriptional regulator/PAS domain-containing protein